MISVSNLSKSYGEVEVLKDLSFEVQKGDIVGLLGQNGAGKTTIMRVITGYVPLNKGSVFVNGLDIQEESLKVKELIGYLPENCPLYPEMSIESFLTTMGELKGLRGKRLNERLEYVLDAVRIRDRRYNIIGTLSKGYRQRVGLAQALIHDPEILILDEPTVGLDPNQIIEIRDLIANLKDERTVILSSHILPEVSQTCEKIIIISEGRIVAQGKERELVRDLSNDNLLYVQVKSDSLGAQDVISKVKGVLDVKVNEEGLLEIEMEEGEDVRALVAAKLIKNKYELLELRKEDMTLEKAFITLTQKD